MQEVAADFIRRVRSIIEAAERGLLTQDDLAAARNSMNALLELDWVMPRTISEVSIQWKIIEESLRTVLEGKVGEQTPAEELQAAWAAYRGIEEAFEDRS